MIELPGFSLGEKIYASQRSQVYRAKRDDGLPVVVKIHAREFPSTEDVRKFRRELEIGRLFDDPCVIRYHDLLPYQQRLALIVEDFGAISLEEHIPPTGLDLAEFLDLARSLAHALAVVHRRGVLHKDVKPRNLVVEPKSGTLKLIDFGIASRLRREHRQLIAPGDLEGTPAYISPEQTGRTKEPIDDRSDFYSLGVTLFEMLTGRRPFLASDVLELVHCHLAQQPPDPRELRPEIPAPLAEIVLKLLAKNAEKRYQSSHGLIADLEQCREAFRAAEKEGLDPREIETFPLGRDDLALRFRLPQRLYGRNEEIKQLNAAWERARRDRRPPDAAAAEILLIAGEPGVGKSALVQEIRRPISAHRGHCVTGKSDPIRRVPYFAWSRAFGRLCEHLLTEGTDQLATWRRRIFEEVGDNAGVLIELVPQLELLLGEQPPVPAAGPREARHRFHLAVHHFLQAISRKDHPLVVFLDDLQWADRASLDLLVDLTAGEAIPHFLILGAYRPGEVDEDHALTATLRRLSEQTGSDVETLHLKNLDLADVHSLIGDALAGTPEHTRELAQLVWSKTDGNAFFVGEFLDSLDAEGLLRQDDVDGRRRWTWDVPKIRARNITDNVVEMMAAKIGRLAPAAYETLMLASCLGSPFRLVTLAAVYERPVGETLEDLWPAVEEGLLIALDARGESFKFSHDRIQEAARSLIDENERRHEHLHIARLLYHHRLTDDAPPASTEDLFEVADQYDLARFLVVEDDERLRLARLDLRAGRLAKDATAYPMAAGYLRHGVEVLPTAAWEKEHDLAFTLHLELAESEYLSTRFEEAEQLYRSLHERARSVDEHLKIDFIQLEQLVVQARFQENVDVGRRALEMLDEPLPETPAEVRALLDAEIAALPELLAGREIEELVDAPPLQGDERIRHLMRLLPSMASGAFFIGRQDIVAWSVARRVNLCLSHGNDPFAPLAYVGFGVNVACNVLGDFELGDRFGRTALALSDRGNHSMVRGRCRILYGYTVAHWRRPLIECMPLLRKAYEHCYQGGDLSYAAYTIWSILSTSLVHGRLLSEIREEAERFLPFLQRTNIPYLEGCIRPGVLRPLAHLFGETASPGSFDSGEDEESRFSEEAFFEQLGQIPNFRASFYTGKIRALCLAGRFSECAALAPELGIIEKVMPSQTSVPETAFFMGLALLAVERRDEADPEQQAKLDEIRAAARRWAEECPANYEHKHLLLEAEIARGAHDVGEAMGLYRRAIASAREQGFVHMEALANELCGGFWLDCGEGEAAHLYLIRARDLYLHWGASAKVALLDAAYPEIKRRPRRRRDDSETQTATAHFGLDLDLGAVIKASQAISSELHLDKLLENMMSIVLTNAGAESGCLLLEKRGARFLDVQVRAGEEVRLLSDQAPAPELPETVLRYVRRTGEELVLGQASRDARFAGDPYVAENQVKSVLCMPVLKQADISGWVYLENNLTARAFTEERVAVLRLLLGQVTISLENALLYDDLRAEIAERRQAEERLKEHAAELEAKNAALERFNYHVSHDLKSPVVTIRNFAGAVLHDVEKGRIKRVVDDVERIADAAETMHRLLEGLLELSRKGHQVGPPQPVDLNTTLQEAVRLVDPTSRLIKIDVAPLPTVLGDPLRLLEVFQNLLENAVKFLGDQTAPRIEVGLLAQPEIDGRSVVYVSDNGVGIEARYLAKIFDLFEQLDPEHEGTGLGLTIVRRMVEAMGGTIWVESDGAGAGSTFFLALRTVH